MQMRTLNGLFVWTKTLITNERGANLVEYAILVAFIVVVSVAAITLIGQETSSKFEPVASTL